LAKLLRFESSHTKEGEYTSLDDYIERMESEQKEIYYFCIPSRDLADSSPYYEPFRAVSREV
jgi:TNF receptor-associated protein 1